MTKVGDMRKERRFRLQLMLHLRRTGRTMWLKRAQQTSVEFQRQHKGHRAVMVGKRPKSNTVSQTDPL